MKNLLHMRMCMHGAGAHLHFVNNKPTSKFHKTFIFSYAKI